MTVTLVCLALFTVMRAIKFSRSTYYIAARKPATGSIASYLRPLSLIHGRADQRLASAVRKGFAED